MSTLEKDNATKDKKKSKVLLKIIKTIYDQNRWWKCALKKAYPLNPEQVFFILLFFAIVFIIMAILEKNLNRSTKDINFFVWKTTYGSSRGFSRRCLFSTLGVKGCNTDLQNFQVTFDLSWIFEGGVTNLKFLGFSKYIFNILVLAFFLNSFLRFAVTNQNWKNYGFYKFAWCQK